MMEISQKCLRGRDKQDLTSYYMEIMEGMIQDMGKAEIDKGKGEYALGMKENSLEQGERIL